mmetsp:Transcript_73169/g.152729  ORF Transcript_73169/g.152729 Transcript_73169/m.152729 type:complete len:95 (+) Transcript_73169:514-798(+)
MRHLKPGGRSKSGSPGAREDGHSKLEGVKPREQRCCQKLFAVLQGPENRLCSAKQTFQSVAIKPTNSGTGEALLGANNLRIEHILRRRTAPRLD